MALTRKNGPNMRASYASICTTIAKGFYKSITFSSQGIYAMTFVLYLLILVCVVFWIYQFIQLMLLTDADFPGKNDKVLWFVAFMLLSVLAPGLFVWWKQSYIHMRNS